VKSGSPSALVAAGAADANMQNATATAACARRCAVDRERGEDVDDMAGPEDATTKGKARAYGFLRSSAAANIRRVAGGVSPTTVTHQSPRRCASVDVAPTAAIIGLVCRSGRNGSMKTET